MIWKAGQKLNNDCYIIEQQVGEGGYGITYLARDKQGNKVVIKTIKDEFLKATNYRDHQKNFWAEIHKLYELSKFLQKDDRFYIKRYIVEFKDSFNEERGNWGKVPCMVMEYIQGENLRQHIEKQGFLEETKALHYIKQIAKAVNILHENNWLHRDINPQNIMLRAKTNEAVLIDFGLTRHFIPNKTNQLTKSATACYAPPEQFSTNKREGCYTDVYALAATLYYLLTKTDPEHANARSINSLTPPQNLNHSVSNRVNQAILAGMELQPEKRLQTPIEWLSLLKLVPDEVVSVDTKGKRIKLEECQAQYFTEDIGNGITLEIAAIPGGKLMMGSPEGEGNDEEKPLHEVVVQPFFMSKYPITQEQWRSVAELPRVNRDLKPHPSSFVFNDHPVETVSWDDAMEFCARLSAETGRKYRLPTEAEWEYACRAGTTTPFYFGKTITSDLANYNANVTFADELKGRKQNETTSVGSFPPNAFGLYDMHGNVWEWCADHFHFNYKGAPNDGSAWVNSHDRMLRGGSWKDEPMNCRSAARDWDAPNSKNNCIGFRVVCV
ncbi:MAG: SUMF1/EgtB/PvdO family nonheme iron enzyme [Aulosira sp. ZfuVER01]|nr:bifunctional serine/threonine-protein kinase/formylglycine-generating enzyme family protein [Aulosira sp. ZfuVER01]MDZ7999562.1 bifunctional serine/threonine-protein kinase/formylglycine-generating enzyme family protein [Aulosira sp. DedVER01a]MDZ8053977.1 bifunctional serine/threonine-protein kinase/formylglycine-generating enzyme family protein [Aulosira sp. ZfuCHP01]